MGITLSEPEIDAFLAEARVAILTTLRADGYPVALPTWFVQMGSALYMRTGSDAAKVARVRRDPRASFLVESGESWSELRAVHFTGIVTVVEDPVLVGKVTEALDSKYRSARTPSERMPGATRRHYDTPRSILCFERSGPTLSWDNRKLRLSQAP